MNAANAEFGFYTLRNATVAYKKAKIDAWRLHSMCADDFIDFERDFKTNLVDFLTVLSEGNREAILSETWLGTWCYQVKKIAEQDKKEKGELFSSPSRNIDVRDVKSLDLRVFARPTVNFHLLGAYWIEMVGAKYSDKLESCVYGNRLRPKPNPRKAGSFDSYLKHLQGWKRNAIEQTNKILEEKKSAVVFTADATAFYHSLKPDFLLDARFLSRVGIELTSEERQLTQLLIDALNFWSSHTPLGMGLPVGLPVSALIANLALIEFDRILQNELKPRYYGRYVDDLLIVMEGREEWKDRDVVWKHIAAASSDLKLTVAQDGSPSLDFEPDYADLITGARISFKGEKCRVYFLDAESGVGFVQRLADQIREASSEFRLLPEHVGSATSVERRLKKLLSSDGTMADSFRKIETMTFRKVDFTGFVKEMEFFHRTLHPTIWKTQREVFYRFIIDNILTLKHYADYEKNLFQVVLPPDAESRLLTREILYTGITRTKNRVFLFGSDKAVEKACKNVVERTTGLS